MTSFGALKERKRRVVSHLSPQVTHVPRQPLDFSIRATVATTNHTHHAMRGGKEPSVSRGSGGHIFLAASRFDPVGSDSGLGEPGHGKPTHDSFLLLLLLLLRVPTKLTENQSKRSHSHEGGSRGRVEGGSAERWTRS
jgi:hypothetical protein